MEQNTNFDNFDLSEYQDSEDELVLNIQNFQMVVFSHDDTVIKIPYQDEVIRQEKDKLFHNSYLKYGEIKDYKGKYVIQAPIIRLYGANSFKQKCCVHVHGYFPYLYVPVSYLELEILLFKKLYQNTNIKQFYDNFMDQLESAYLQIKKPKQKNQETKFQPQIIYNYEIVKAMDFYGYHQDKEEFIKIYVYDQKFIKTIVAILERGVINNIQFQCYESHLTNFTKFYADKDIYGLNEINIYNFKFRKNQSQERMDQFSKFFIENSVLNQDVNMKKLDLKFFQKINQDQFSRLEKQSTCYVELDVHHSNIISHKQIQEQKFNNENQFCSQQTQDSYEWNQIEKILEKDLIEKDIYRNEQNFYVEITDALKNFWKDEQKQRDYFQIKIPIERKVSWIANIESTLDYKLNQLDNLQIDRKYEDSIWIKFMEHLDDFYDSLKIKDQKLQERLKLQLESYYDIEKREQDENNEKFVNGNIFDVNQFQKPQKKLNIFMLDKRKIADFDNLEKELKMQRRKAFYEKYSSYYKNKKELFKQSLQNNVESDGSQESNDDLDDLVPEELKNEIQQIQNEEEYEFNLNDLEFDQQNLKININNNLQNNNYSLQNSKKKNINSQQQSQTSYKQSQNSNTIKSRSVSIDSKDSRESSISSLDFDDQMSEISDSNDDIQTQISKKTKNAFTRLFKMSKNTNKNNAAFWFRNYNVKNVDNIKSLNNTNFQKCPYCQQFANDCNCTNLSKQLQFKNKNQNFQQNNNNIDNKRELNENYYITNFTDNYNKQNFQFIFQYQKKPPKFQEIDESLTQNKNRCTYNYPYFDNNIDLFTHYKISDSVPKTDNNAQLLAQKFIKKPLQRYYSVSLSQKSRYPEFIRLYLNSDYEQMQKENKKYELDKIFSYLKKPPLLQDILGNKTFKIEEKIPKILKPTPYKIDNPKGKITVIKTKNDQNNEQQREFMPDITTFLVEIFAKSIANKEANPENDSIEALFYSLSSQKSKLLYQENDTQFETYLGVIIVDQLNFQNFQQEQSQSNNFNLRALYKLPQYVKDIIVVKDEVSLIKSLILIIFKIDPDILGGYDIQKKSLNYIIQRAYLYQINFIDLIGRCPKDIDQIFSIIEFSDYNFIQNQDSLFSDQNLKSHQKSNINSNSICDVDGNNSIFDTQKSNNQSQFYQQNGQDKKKFQFQINRFTKIRGRAILNIWNICRKDLRLTNYELENVIYDQFKVKLPQFSNWTLTQRYNKDLEQKSKVLEYFLKRLKYTERIIDKLGTVLAKSEQTRLYGCDFESTISKKSQFRIECVLYRVTKARGYLLLSANKTQVAYQKTIENMAYIIEPEKIFFVDPLLVLDFQSLYPSIMISHNYCYSTCLGHIEDSFIEGKTRFGVKDDTNIELGKLFQGKTYQQIKNDIFISPNKVAFVRKHVRVGIIPQVLSEFLNTRIMLKKSVKLYKNENIKKNYTFRQMGLKLFMNVTYGYTAASYSGRMPSVDIGDTVVATGRGYLEQLIQDVNNNKEWQAKVVYGDTDSVFVHLQGRSKKEAFRIGQEMAKEMSINYPYPMELKFEKVYTESILVSKKRYIGNRFENFNEEKPFLEAKGIETVRRDGCKIQQNIMINCVEELFKSKNLSNIKLYLNKQWNKIHSNKMNAQHFIISKEVKLGSYTAEPPAHAQVALKMIKQDPILRPKAKERVPYVVIQGNEKDRVRDLAISLKQYHSSKNNKINHEYYCTRMINSSLHRLFSTFQVKVDNWYKQKLLGKCKKNIIRQQQQKIHSKAKNLKIIQNSSLDSYISLKICFLCFKDSEYQICKECIKNPLICYNTIQNKLYNIQEIQEYYQRICLTCSDLSFHNIKDIECIEYNCQILHEKQKVLQESFALQPIYKKFQQVFEQNYEQQQQN